MKITIFGYPGTGTSTVGKLLSSKLEYEFKSSGNMFREMAAEHGLSVEDFDTLAQTESKHDIALDSRVEEYGKTHDNFVFESRLAWNFIPDSVKISLVCDEDEAARRVAKRDGITPEEAKKNNEHRHATYMVRYPKYYPGLVYPPTDETFDLIVDVTTIAPEEILEKVLTFLQNEKGLTL